MKFFRRKAEVVSTAPTDPETIQAASVEEYFNRGMRFYALEKYDQAIADFKQALSMDATAVDPHYGLGLVYKAQGRNEEAAAAFKEVLGLIEKGALDDKFDKKNMLQRICKSHIRSLSDVH
jgi:tetratricopeptide (TPR) repeat protein